MNGIIYKYTSPSNKVYIGQTLDETRRRKEFLDENIEYAGKRINAARKKYKPHSFKYEILFKKTYGNVIDALKELNELESYYIEKYNSFKNGYNMTLGGEGVRGIVFDENTKSKIRETLKKFYNNKPNPFKGKRHSLETRKKLSEIAKKRKYSPNKGKKLSFEQRKKISERNKLNVGEKNPFFGKKHTDKTKELIGNANSKPVLQIDINNGNILRVFKSAKEAGLFFGKPKGNSEIVKVCKNYISPQGKHYLTAFGYKWAYATTEDSTTNERVSSDTTE